MTEHTVDVANAGIVPRSNYEMALHQIIADGLCPFCAENLSRVHPDPILWSNHHWIVTTNAYPYSDTRHQFLLIATRHIECIQDLTPEERLQFFDDFDRLSRTYEYTGASILWRSGPTEQTGATVKHLHAHIFVGYPRTEGASVITGLLGFGPPLE